MHKMLRLRARARSLHVSSPSRHLVGPNDPVSNLRPIIYTDTPHSQAQRESHVNHPYSLNEFADVPHDHTLELQYKLAREQLDAFNHNYWSDVCRVASDRIRFTSALTTISRATLGSKWPSNPSWRLSLNLPHLEYMKMRSQSFTKSG